uniref:Uncharacterized protein n=1 Tax=Podoviridae sp. ctP1X6 TaxID=2825246 RepID=A0A8S5U483_9CAUD|nr:MAG TPA: hypothetical protein [Podoviridae sp. ctP1X6]
MGDNMEKEKVLEIESQEVFDKVAVRIKYQNFEVLKRGEFKDEEIIVESACVPDYINLNNKLYIQGEAESADNRVFLIDKEDLKNILEKVNKINEKYGIPKRWRAEENDCYYTIFGENIEKKSLADDKFYNLGNYFKTKEEAQKVKEELDKFWAKVRAGEIEND